MFVVRAVFTLVDGTQMLGYLTPPVQQNEGLGALQPVIICERGQVGFWQGVIAPDAASLAKSYAKLGRDAVRVFPIQVVSDTELVGRPVHAEIPGFLVLEDWKTARTRVVK